MPSARSKYELTAVEKAIVKRKGIRLKQLGNYQASELAAILDSTIKRAKEVYAHYEFQTIPSVGVRFAEDLIAMGYYSLEQLKKKNGPDLIYELELLKGYWQDPCVEDQCLLAVHFANHHDPSIKWWDFTAERKAYRIKHGYPKDRPTTAWHETLEHNVGNRAKK